ncbi:MAG: 2-hydroxychromene-2-carboxylate isomerase [Alphaproteobacteria bacterium]|nr:2-hydroxychromene-2-carboxylate isomerase [Alphaproteobacteria bacterium]
MQATVELFYDVSSPWTYLCFHNLLPLTRELGADLRLRPVLVGGIFNTVNPSVYQSRENPVPAKQAYMGKDLQDWARLAGVTIVFPPKVFPVNSVKALRACLWAEEQGPGRQEALARALFEAYWGSNQDISRDDVLGRCLAKAGLDPQAALNGINEDRIKGALKTNTDEAMRRGAFGSPTMFVNERDMYFGNDRLPLVAAAIKAAQAI